MTTDGGIFQTYFKFGKRLLKATEVRRPEDIVNNFAIRLEFINKGQTHSLVHTMIFKEDPSGEKRPIIFKDKNSCIEYVQNLFFKDTTLRVLHINDSIVNSNTFKQYGAFLIEDVTKNSGIIVI